MKKIIPLKYIFYTIILFIVLPIILASLLLVLINDKNNIIIVLIMFLYFWPFLSLIILKLNKVNILINIHSGDVSNNIRYNMDSCEWTKNIKNTKEIYILDNKNDIARVFKNAHKPRKLLVFVFINQEIKFIPLTMFTKKQINTILQIINQIKKN